MDDLRNNQKKFQKCIKKKLLKLTSFIFMDALMEELMWAAKNKILTAQQFEILEKRSLGWTYKSIISHFKLSGEHAIITCLTSTIQSKF